MIVPTATRDGITMTQVGQWVRVQFPDGTEARVISVLTNNPERQQAIIRAAGYLLPEDRR